MTALQHQFENIPADLKNLDQWVSHKNKIPYNPTTGAPASSTDPDTWATFDQAKQALENVHNYDGVGYVLGNGIVGIDLDKCRDPETGKVEEWAEDIVFSFGSYTEISPSGTGLHIICWSAFTHTGVNKGNLEAYTQDRYFTMTGNVYDDGVRTIEDCTEEHYKLWEEHGKKETKVTHSNIETDDSEMTPDDYDLLKRIIKNRGDDFSALYLGDKSQYDNDDSAADMALCNILAFWTKNDTKQMDRLFRYSGLYREKWERRDYRERTIAEAVRSNTGNDRQNGPTKSKTVKPKKTRDRTHIEIADQFIAETYPRRDEVVGYGGAIWAYNYDSGLWEEITLTSIAPKIGRMFSNEANCKRGSDYKAIATLVHDILAEPNFFYDAPVGAPCKSYFYSVEGGKVSKKPYSPELRQRAKLAYDPLGGDFPLFTKYVNESFAGEHKDQQIYLLQEVMGGLITCCWQRIQKAILLYGYGENGKSLLLTLLTDFFPKELRTAVSPTDFKDRTMNCALAGKVINIVGEVEPTSSLTARFKDFVACDTPINSRAPYGQAFTFTPRAAHIFSTNEFPMTKDHTHGFYRRWLIFDFPNRVVKKDTALAKKILKNEAEQVLAWALIGAERLAGNDFVTSQSDAHDEKMVEWKLRRDTVHAFLHDIDYVELGPDLKDVRSSVMSSLK